LRKYVACCHSLFVEGFINKLKYSYVWCNFIAFLLIAMVAAFSYASGSQKNSTRYEKPQDLMGIGLSEMDIIGFVDDEYIKRYLLVPYAIHKGSISFVDRETWTHLRSELQEYVLTPSGEVATLLLIYASLGGKPTFNTVLANDEYGKHLLDILGSLKVNIEAREGVFNNETMTNLVYVTPEGTATHVLINRHGAKISQKDIKYHLIKDYKMIVAEAKLWDGMLQSKAVLRAYKTAKKVGTKTVLLLSDPLFAKKYKEDFLDLFGHLDIVLANDFSMLELMDTKDFNTMLEKLSKFNTLIVITRGAQGAVAIKGKEVHYIPANNIEEGKIIDKTGSHAAFSAGFLYGYNKGKSIEEAGQIGARTASHMIQQVGRNPQTNLSKILYEYSNN
jgi:sugar/nucleoside kinase (ribokinase family)